MINIHTLPYPINAPFSANNTVIIPCPNLQRHISASVQNTRLAERQASFSCRRRRGDSTGSTQVTPGRKRRARRVCGNARGSPGSVGTIFQSRLRNEEELDHHPDPREALQSSQFTSTPPSRLILCSSVSPR